MATEIKTQVPCQDEVKLMREAYQKIRTIEMYMGGRDSPEPTNENIHFQICLCEAFEALDAYFKHWNLPIE